MVFMIVKTDPVARPLDGRPFQLSRQCGELIAVSNRTGLAGLGKLPGVDHVDGRFGLLKFLEQRQRRFRVAADGQLNIRERQRGRSPLRAAGGSTLEHGGQELFGGSVVSAARPAFRATQILRDPQQFVVRIRGDQVIGPCGQHIAAAFTGVAMLLNGIIKDLDA